jgi:predicted TIM-barrel fold metal-dependent hydrolase
MFTRRDVLLGTAAAGVGALLPRTNEVSAAPSQPTTPVGFSVPPGACDTHVHLFGEEPRYPFAPSSSYKTVPATADESRAMHHALHVARVALIQPSAYGSDNSCILDGVKRRGAAARAVVRIDETTSDKALDEMHRLGARGVREDFDSLAEARQGLDRAARRIAGRNWHINTNLRVGMLESLADQLMALPVPVVIDHWAGANPALGTGQPGFDVLLELLRKGKVYVKLTHIGPALLPSAPGADPVEPLAKAMVAANPQRIFWGTNWPHQGPRPRGYKLPALAPHNEVDDGALFNRFAVWVPDAVQRKTILADNPATLYGF